MYTLSVDELKKVPWIGTASDGTVYEPPVEEMNEMSLMGFMNRGPEFPLFYSWVEILNGIHGNNKRILDSCCGRGMLSQLLMLKGHGVSACDLMGFFMGDKSGIEFQQVDLNGPMPYRDHEFDFIVNCEGIQYLNGFAPYLKECARVLKDGGTLILSVPNIHSISGRVNFLRKGMLTKYHVEDERIYWQIVYMPYLLEMLKKEGFNVVQLRGNVPDKSKKIKIFDKTLGRFMVNPVPAEISSLLPGNEGERELVKFAHSLIIEAKLRGI